VEDSLPIIVEGGKNSSSQVHHVLNRAIHIFDEGSATVGKEEKESGHKEKGKRKNFRSKGGEKKKTLRSRGGGGERYCKKEMAKVTVRKLVKEEGRREPWENFFGVPAYLPTANEGRV